MSGESAISVQGLRKTFGGRPVLGDVSFEVAEGETFALLGRNGAGKTTTIRILLGLLAADAGKVRVAGLDPAIADVELRRKVGYLAEDQAMYAWMSAAELCAFLKPFYPTWDDQLAGKLLDGFEVPRYARISTLSKGEAVKLGLAVAIAHRPVVAIFDDPALGLDPIARKQFSRDLVEYLQSAGRTVVYSSHLLDEVEVVADTVAILDGGRIVRQAATESLRRDVGQVSLSLEAARSLTAPEGLLDARQHGGQLVVTIDGVTGFVNELTRGGIEHSVEVLSLDEIFEAFVIGRTKDWPTSTAAVGVAIGD